MVVKYLAIPVMHNTQDIEITIQLILIIPFVLNKATSLDEYNTICVCSKWNGSFVFHAQNVEIPMALNVNVQFRCAICSSYCVVHMFLSISVYIWIQLPC